MPDYKLFNKCFACKKKKLYISRKELALPIGRMAKSREYFCPRCWRRIETDFMSGIMN